MVTDQVLIDLAELHLKNQYLPIGTTINYEKVSQTKFDFTATGDSNIGNRAEVKELTIFLSEVQARDEELGTYVVLIMAEVVWLTYRSQEQREESVISIFYVNISRDSGKLCVDSVER